jgi:hypothetical protein
MKKFEFTKAEQKLVEKLHLLEQESDRTEKEWSNAKIAYDKAEKRFDIAETRFGIMDEKIRNKIETRLREEYPSKKFSYLYKTIGTDFKGLNLWINVPDKEIVEKTPVQKLEEEAFNLGYGIQAL